VLCGEKRRVFPAPDALDCGSICPDNLVPSFRSNVSAKRSISHAVALPFLPGKRRAIA
jgi:hypothetical protein